MLGRVYRCKRLLGLTDGRGSVELLKTGRMGAGEGSAAGLGREGNRVE